MVEYVDGSILAQLGPTDMRMPIQYALTYPLRVASKECTLDWSKLKKLEFEPVSEQKFPCLAASQGSSRKRRASPMRIKRRR